MAISAIGVGSGLPLDELLSDLRKSESQSLALIQSRQSDVQSKLSAYGKLKGSVEQLQTAAKALDNPDIWGALKASASGDSFTAKASTDAVAGNYQVHVQQLATTQTLASAGVADPTSAMGSGGQISFTLGDGSQHTVTLSGNNTSLEDIAQAINKQSKLGIQASILNDGTESPYRLLLSTTQTGTDAAISAINISGNSGGQNQLQQLLGFGESAPESTITEQAASNAQLSINGISLHSQSNTIDNALQGITLQLNKTSDEAARLSVTRDDKAAQKAVHDFVDAYNSLQKNLRSLSSYDVENNKASALTGDPLVRRLQSQVREALMLSGQSGPIRSLNDLGIQSSPSNGQLSINEDTLNSALRDNVDAVKNLFTHSNQSLVNRVNTVTNSFLRPDGAFDSANKSATRQINDLKKQYEVNQARIEARMETYRRQFTALDSMVAQMDSLSVYLNQQLSMLNSFEKK